VTVAADTAVAPIAFLRRSFVYRALQGLGARFGEVAGGAVAMDFGAAGAELERGRRMAIADLSPLPRTGFKGTGTVEWLTGQGLSIGPESNKGHLQSGGELALRLAPTEILLVDALAGTGTLPTRLNATWSWGQERPRKLIGYPMPRSESHFWFAVTGAQAPSMFAKICGVDLRPQKFAPGAIAQTSVAKMSAIIVRHDAGTVPGFYLLADSASAEYMWACVVDAMAEFGGGPIGLTTLRTLAGG
jgi:sarcosine oxidase subunit gamma